MRALAISALLTVLVVPAGSFAANQLTNPNFTADVSGWTPGGWVVTWTGSEGFVTLAGAARAVATSSGSAIGSEALTQCTAAVPSGIYDFGAGFKIDPTSTQTGSARLRVTWYTVAGCASPFGGGPFVDPTSAAGWQTLAVTSTTAPATANSALVELIQAVDAAGNFVAFWDDVYFGPHPTPVELVSFSAE